MKIPKTFKLVIKWSKKENDYVVLFPRKGDGMFISNEIINKRLVRMLTESVNKEPDKECYSFFDSTDNVNIGYYQYDWLKALDKRGFDLTTLKFEICIKKTELQNKFKHLWEDLSEKERNEVKKLGFIVTDIE
jgi:hypothetical protein